jgi:molybdate transport system substrate-binding protein
MRKPIAILSALVAVLGVLALPPVAASAADTIVVSAAASLRNAFEEIGALFAAATGGPRPVFNFGASGDLVAQIRGGAPADIFAAAAAKDMDGLETEGALLPGTRVDFATNEVVLVVPSAATGGVSSFAELAKPGIARVAIVNPKTSPAGRYAEEVFASAGIANAVRPKLVLAENVRQVLDYVARGEVDAGIVYATDAAIRPQEVRVAVVAPSGSHMPVVYPIAVLRRSSHLDAATALVAAVRSDAGQAILARYGFKPVPAAR